MKMNMVPSFTNIRSYISYRFSTLRTNAVRYSFWANMIGRQRKLEIFPEQAPEKSPNRTFIGEVEIPIQAITGTMSRQSDFDHQFRPLKRYLRDRWVNAYLAIENEGLSPILVHRVGGKYYVEDGHHRISVARALGMASISANVWEYPILEKPTNKDHAVEYTDIRAEKAFQPVTE